MNFDEKSLQRFKRFHKKNQIASILKNRNQIETKKN